MSHGYTMSWTIADGKVRFTPQVALREPVLKAELAAWESRIASSAKHVLTGLRTGINADKSRSWVERPGLGRRRS
jgi:hypothetical protein